ncbi:hypothetical protein L6452_43489 [Arctium lappa]|uniref:Uncharacterized protein n=1 Tax=Arctium lappa TaxID=4217 RepID=A0ACB8XDK7_ARCLA|nr:hypothetical protein L6452_43489 [Arctium lappa]
MYRRVPKRTNGLISATILITYTVKYVSNSSTSATKSSLTDRKRSIEPLGHNLQLDELENSHDVEIRAQPMLLCHRGP